MVADSIYVRGFSPAYFLDGMMRNMSYTGIPRIEPYLLDRVELLRGPASILYGQGSAGGVVNALTKRPGFEAAGEVAVEYGSWDRKQVQGDLTGPLNAAATVAGRIVALYRDADQQTDYLKDDRVLLAPSLTWEPTGDTSVTLLGAYQRDLNGSSQQFLPVAATSLLGGPGLPLSRFLGEPEFDRQLSRQWTVTGALEHRLADALLLRSTTRYAHSRVAFDEIYPDVYSNPADPFLDADKRIVGRTPPYVSYSESFQPVAGLDAYDQRFKPQRGRQWEAGVKWQPVNPLLLTATVFDIRETNRPTIDPANPVNTIQTGRARSRGVEFEAGYTLPAQLTITAAYSYVDAAVLESNTPAEIGVQFGEVPKHTASAWAMKAFDIEDGSRLRLGAGVRYVGSVLSTTEGWRLRTPGYTLVDALAEWERDNWILSVRASNLLDKDYFAACRVYGDCFTGNGRNVVGSIGYRF